MGDFEVRKAAATKRLVLQAATPSQDMRNYQEHEQGANHKLLINRKVTSSDTREAADSNRLVCKKNQQIKNKNMVMYESLGDDTVQRRSSSSSSSKYREPVTVCLYISTPSLVVIIASLMLLFLSPVLTFEEQTRVATAATKNDSHLLESLRKISNSSEHQLSSSFHYQPEYQSQYSDIIYESSKEAQQQSNSKIKEVNKRRTLERQEEENSAALLAKQQNNQHQDQQKANNNLHYQHEHQGKLNDASGRRMKRNAAGWSQHSSSLESPAACTELLSAWTYFRSVYPALASHLFVLASPGRLSLAGLKSHSQHLNEVAQSVGKLLDEAERLLRSERPAKSATWLSRAMTNPAYARIIHHHLQQQRQQHQHQRQQPTRPPTEAVPTEDGHVYGRLLHYPHQLEQGNSAATSRTLEKLRQLSGQQRVNQQQTSAGAVDRLSSAQDDEQLESNRIPVIAGDGESHWLNGEQSGGSWKNRARVRPSSSNDVNSLRNNFVYGNVIYKPITASQSQKEGETQQLYHRQNPIETLRQLTATASNNRENENNNNKQQQQLTTTSSNYKSLSTNKQPSVKANSESYGRILVSPASSSSSRSGNSATSAESASGAAATSFREAASSSQAANNNEQSTQFQSADTPLLAAQAPKWPQKSTLDKLRQQLALNEPLNSPSAGAVNIFPVDAHLLMDNSELVSQQEVGSQAAIANEQHQEQLDSDLLLNPGASNDENEFEGEWHSGPIQQVEVRQLRTENINGQPRQLLITRTTANPRDAFLVE